jgi:hypothetical protein
VAGFNLRSGRSLSCGSCGKRKKHGHARAGAKSYYYQIWARTVHLNRGNPSPPIYRRWKGKGGFIRFFQDVLDNIGPKPSRYQSRVFSRQYRLAGSKAQTAEARAETQALLAAATSEVGSRAGAPSERDGDEFGPKACVTFPYGRKFETVKKG